MAPKSLTDIVASVGNPRTRGQGLKDFLDFMNRNKCSSTEEILDSLILPSLIEVIAQSQNGENNEILYEAVRALNVILVRILTSSKHLKKRMNDMLTEELIENLLLLWTSENNLVFPEVLHSVGKMAALNGDLRTRIMRCGIASAALKIRCRLHGPEREGDVTSSLLEAAPPEDVPDVLESAILHVTLTVLAEESVCPTPEQFRELLPLISRTLNKGYQGRDFLRALDILEHLVGKVKTAADAVHASGLVPKLVRFLDLSNSLEVKVKVLQLLIKFVGEGSKFCKILLGHNVLEKVRKLVHNPEQIIIQTLSLELLQAIAYNGSILAKRMISKSKLYRDLAILYHRSSLHDKKVVLGILQCIHSTDTEGHLPAEFRRLLDTGSFSIPKF